MSGETSRDLQIGHFVNNMVPTLKMHKHYTDKNWEQLTILIFGSLFLDELLKWFMLTDS